MNPGAPYFSLISNEVVINENWPKGQPLPFPTPLRVHVPDKVSSPSFSSTSTFSLAFSSCAAAEREHPTLRPEPRSQSRGCLPHFPSYPRALCGEPRPGFPCNRDVLLKSGGC